MNYFFSKYLKVTGYFAVIYVFAALLNLFLIKPGYLLGAIYYSPFKYEPKDWLLFPLPLRDKIAYQILKIKGFDSIDDHFGEINDEEDYKVLINFFLGYFMYEPGYSMKLSDQFKFADSMIAVGLDPNKRDRYNCTALQYIFKFEGPESDNPDLLKKVEYLISRGATWRGQGTLREPVRKGFYCTRKSMDRYIQENPKAWQMVQSAQR